MIQFVVSNQAVDINGEIFAYPNNSNGTTVQIPCDQTEIIGSYWRIPQYTGNRLVGYVYAVATNTSVKPYNADIKVLSVKLTNTAGVTQMMLAIVDTDNVSTTSPQNQLAFLCDGLGGTLPVMPMVTIPVPIQQSGPQSTSTTTGANTFIFPFPSNPQGLEYAIGGEWYNFAAPSPVFAPSGLTTVALVAAWFVTNRSAYGTWTNPTGDILQLVSAAGGSQVLLAGIVVTLAPVNFCFDLTAFGGSPANVDGVKFGTGTIIPLPSGFVLTDNNVTLMNVLLHVMSSGTIFNTTTVHKLGMNTTQAQPHLYYGTTLVATAATGVC